MRSKLAVSRRYWQGTVAAAFILVCLLITLIAPVAMGASDPNDISPDILAAPGSAGHPLGTDQLGRDILARLVHGVRVSFTVGVAAALITVVVGGALGAVAGYFGNVADAGLSRLTELFQAMPGLVLAAVIVALAGPGLSKVILVIAIVSWPQAARLMRGQVLQTKQHEFVSAVRCLGVPGWRLLLAEVVPNAARPIVALTPLIVAQAILLEAGLSFLGLSSPSTVSWGAMLNDGQEVLFQAWWVSTFAGLAILLSTVAFNLTGDLLNDLLDPRKVYQ